MAQTSKKPTKAASGTDSLFGMMLAHAFLGVAFGVQVGEAFEACQGLDEVYTDRQSPASMGAKKHASLNDAFACPAYGQIAMSLQMMRGAAAPTPHRAFVF